MDEETEAPADELEASDASESEFDEQLGDGSYGSARLSCS